MKEPGIERWLGSKNAADVEMAEQALEQMGTAAAIEYLRRIFVSEDRKRYKHLWALRLSLALAVSLAGYYGTSLGKDSVAVQVGIQMGIFLIIGATSVFEDYLLPPSRRLRNAATLLSQYDSPLAVGALIEVHKSLAWKESHAAKDALKRLMPHLQPSDAGLLNEKQRAYLYMRLKQSDRVYSWVGERYDVNYLRAILTAIGQIGDSQSLPHVERLARSSNIPGIKEAAQACLLSLEQRLSVKVAHG